MKLISARSRRAPAPLSTANRAPEIFVARSKSMMPSAVPRSQCAFGSKSNARGSPWRRASAIVRRGLPDRHAVVRQVGQRQQRGIALVLDGVELDAELLDLLIALPARLLDVGRVLPLALRLGDLVARRVLLAFEALVLTDEPLPQALERRDVFERLVGIEAAVSQPFTDLLDVVTNVCGIQHVA